MNKQQRYHIIVSVLCFVLIAAVDIASGNQYHMGKPIGPVNYLVKKALDNRIILVGTHHKNDHIHDIIISSLPLLAESAGVNTLFMEIPSSQQEAIDSFLKQKADVENIRIPEIIASASYREILFSARSLGMNIIAMDRERPDRMSRDKCMSLSTSSYLKVHPQSKGVIIVGERHVLKNIQWTFVDEPSLADYLSDYKTCSIITWPEALEYRTATAIDIDPERFKGVKDKTLMSMNTLPHVCLATTADGVIFVP